MLIELPNWMIALLNALGVPFLHLACSWLVTKLPLGWIFPRCICYAPFAGERLVWERLFLVRAWKKFLPDAGPWFGGESKGQLQSTDPAYLAGFVEETKRGEFAHGLQIVAISGLMIWTPEPWAWLILGYALLSNLPCMVSLRYARLRLQGVLLRIKGASKNLPLP